MIIDDEDALCEIIKNYFEDYGFIVDTANSGNKALDLISKNRYDVAIVDMRLPDITGNELIIAANKICSGVKYLIHTGSLEYRIPRELINIGVNNDSVIYKPVHDLNEIYKKII